ncbi:MAG: hypothetical protein LBE01_06005 [Deltaproteobacteria bacterium]|jgi:hypothetical protein|nr:hypothetical protein [Deltaproteobacteria bacterium]
MDTLARAEEALKEEKIDEAEALLAEVLAQEPDDERALGDWGLIGLKRKDSKRAISAFTRVLELNPENVAIRKHLALELMVGDQPGLAQAHLEKLVSVNQNDFQAWAMLSRLAKNRGDLKAAKENAERSLTIDPNQPSLKAWLASLADPGAAKPAPPPKARASQLTFLCLPGEEEEADLLGESLERSLSVKKVVSLKDEPYLAALAGRGALWLDGLSPRSVSWLSRLEAGPRPVVLRLSRKDLDFDLASAPLAGVSSLLFETKALMDLFLAKGLKPRAGSTLNVVGRAVDLSQVKSPGLEKASGPLPSGPEGAASLGEGLEGAVDLGEGERPAKGRGEPLSLAYAGDWSELGLVLEAFLVVRRLDPKATMWSWRRPKTVEAAKLADHCVARDGVAGSVLFATPSLGREEFFRGRSHYLDVSMVAAGEDAFMALAYGLRPLIRDGLGAKELFPADFLWARLEDLPGLLAAQTAVSPAEWARRATSVDHLAERALSLL